MSQEEIIPSDIEYTLINDIVLCYGLGYVHKILTQEAYNAWLKIFEKKHENFGISFVNERAKLFLKLSEIERIQHNG